MKILIITGGDTSERKISFISAKQIKNGLKVKGHQVRLFDLLKGYQKLSQDLKDYDVIFPVLHGKDGEDGKLYKFLISKKVPFVGSDPNGAKIAFDKILFKRYCDENKVSTAKWRVVKSKEDIMLFELPCVLKAAYGGSSKEVVLLKSKKDLSKKSVDDLLNIRGKLYVEKLLDGVEVTVGILGQKALPVVEIIPPNLGWFDYKNKYSGQTNEIVGAPSVKSKIIKQVQKVALNLHQQFKLGQYSRSDFIIVGDIPYILEINTPGGVGMTPQSLFPKAAKGVGLDFSDLVEKLVRLAVEEYESIPKRIAV